MKIYTGGGDRGKTSLFSGERISKSDIKVEAYGDVDELNSVIGALIASVDSDDGHLIERLRLIQSNLLSAGAWLSVNPGSDSASMLEAFSLEHVADLESFIDFMDEELPTLRQFILPGGTASSAFAHIARTVCRRAERHVVLALEQSVARPEDESLQNIVSYLNRLSDCFYVMARYLNHLSGLDDILWKK